MTLNLSENSWAKPGAILAILFALVILWAYLASGIFLVAFDHKFSEAKPWTIYQYWYHYGGKQKIVNQWLLISGGISLAFFLVPAGLLFAPAKKSLFGSARFATKSEIKKAGLFGLKGLIVGKLGGKFLMFDGQQHVMLSAPTRSGKGVGMVITNLLNWPDSVVVLDIKQENWDVTSAYRRKYGHQCYLFNPAAANYKTHCYNPLTYISDNPHLAIDDIQKIANMLFPDKPGTDIIWTATPRSLFLAIVMYLRETPGKLLTIGQVLRETQADGDGFDYFTRIITDRATSDNPLSPACVRAFNAYLGISSDKTRSGVMVSFRSKLDLWQNPLIDAATSSNDFDLRRVRKERMSIYLCTTPDNLDRLAPLLNLFFQQLVDLNTRVLPSQDKEIKFPCLLLMDEFTAIGPVNILSKGISFIAGYWLRMMPIIQSPAQLVEVYGKDAAQTFLTNHAMTIVFPPKASETQNARDISEWFGYQTVKGVSESKGKGLLTKKEKSESESDQRRALMLPQEITSLGQTKEFIVLENVPPIVAKRVVYFKDRVFLDRLKEVSPRLKALGWLKKPTREQMDEAIELGELRAPVPTLDIDRHLQAVNKISGPIQVATPNQVVVARPIVPEDLPKVAKANLSRFKIDFSAIEVPKAGDMNIEALHKYSDAVSDAAFSGASLNL